MLKIYFDSPSLATERCIFFFSFNLTVLIVIYKLTMNDTSCPNLPMKVVSHLEYLHDYSEYQTVVIWSVDWSLLFLLNLDSVFPARFIDIQEFNEWMTKINLTFCYNLMDYQMCRFFFVRAGMMGWLLINLSILMKSIQDGTLSQSMILYQLFCAVISKTCMSFVKWKCIILCDWHV